MKIERKMWGPARFKITRTDGTAHEITVNGRTRWALQNLAEAGERGCTPIDHPGPRWSAYTFNLRHDYKVEIETLHEKHGAPFEGTHARYVAKSRIEPIAPDLDGGAA